MKADIKTIEELMKILYDQKLTEVSYEDTNFKATIKGSANGEIKKEIRNDKKPVEIKETVKYKEVLSDHIGRYFYMKKDGTPIIEVGQ
ncbi:MAG: hypothetical protein Q4B33_03645, partial [Fusobacterium sp.]|nr:hypothetical protein [Fusobacterium sp.]